MRAAVPTNGPRAGSGKVSPHRHPDPTLSVAGPALAPDAATVRGGSACSQGGKSPASGIPCLSVSSPLGDAKTAVSDAAGVAAALSGPQRLAAFNAKRAAEVAKIAEDLRRLVEAGNTVRGAARILGIHDDRAKSMAQRLGIRATNDVVAQARGASSHGKSGQKGPNDHLVPRMRELVAAGETVRGAGAHLGLGPAQAKRLAERFGIKASAAALQAHRDRIRALAVEVLKARAKAKPKKARQRADHERRSAKVGLTEAQQQQIVAQKRRMWSGATRLPPVTEEEAARLIAEHIAKRGVTVCPPAAPVEKPINGGAGWR